MSFSDLKKKSQSDIEQLTKEIQKMGKSGDSYRDDRFWTCERDKSGNGFAVIRFLPASKNEDIPWARTFSHGFQGKGGWFIENCPTTVGGKCPVCEANSELWNSGVESDKEIARQRKRKLSYTANILVVSDPANRENEGKVFLYKFGKKIFDKIMEKMQPQFEDEEAMNPFDFWNGANFKLKVRMVGGFVNYDKSEFESPSELFDGNDEKLEELWNSQNPLKEFTDPEQFKSYGELKTKLDSVLHGASSGKRAEHYDEDSRDVNEAFGSSNVSEVEKSSSEDSTGEEDALSYFQKLAND